MPKAFLTTPAPRIGLVLAALLLATAAPAQTVPRTVIPVATPRGGTFSSLDGPLFITLTNPMSDAVIWYTLDGSVPLPRKAMRYSGPLYTSQSLTVKAMATREGHESSDVMVEAYTFVIAPKVAMPAPTPPGGVYAGDSLEIILTCATAGATLYYSTTEMGPAGVQYVPGTRILLRKTTELRAFAALSGHYPSDTLRASFTLQGDILGARSLRAPGPRASGALTPWRKLWQGRRADGARP